MRSIKLIPALAAAASLLALAPAQSYARPRAHKHAAHRLHHRHAAVTGACRLTLEAPTVITAGEAIEGAPAKVLTGAAAGADLLVLGSHGHGRLFHVVLGSVAEECIRVATCPVVVVPVARPRQIFACLGVGDGARSSRNEVVARSRTCVFSVRVWLSRRTVSVIGCPACPR